MCSLGKYLSLLHGFFVTNGVKKQSDIHYSWSGDHIIFIIIRQQSVMDVRC